MPVWMQWAVASASVVAAVVGVVKLGPSAWSFLRRFVRTVDSLGELPDELVKQAEFRETTNATLDAQNRQLSILKHEVMPNNGGSLRDAVDKQGAALSDVQSKLANDDIRIIALQSRDSRGRFAKEEK